MNIYDGERWALDRHSELVRDAELLARLVSVDGGGALGAWLASRLRAVADRLDAGAALDPQPPVVIRSLRRPAP